MDKKKLYAIAMSSIGPSSEWNTIAGWVFAVSDEEALGLGYKWLQEHRPGCQYQVALARIPEEQTTDAKDKADDHPSGNSA